MNGPGRRAGVFHINGPSSLLWLLFAILLPATLVTGCRSSRLPVSGEVENQGAVSTSNPGVSTQDRSSSSNSTAQVPEATSFKSGNFETYHHADDSFRLQFPAGWRFEQDEFSVVFENSSGEERMKVSLLPARFTPDQASFLRLVEAREQVACSGFEDYIEKDRKPGRDGNALWLEKELSVDGNRKTVLTSYQIANETVYVIDFWSDPESLVNDRIVLEAIVDSLQSDRKAIFDESQLPDSLNYEVVNDYFSIRVPVFWTYTPTQGEHTRVDTFRSPDEETAVQVIVYDDGLPMSRSVAGDFVQVLLRDYYTKDIHVTSDRWLPNGRERLDWTSLSSSYEGISYFEVHGTSLLIFTAMFDKENRGENEGVVDQILSSYQVREREPE